MPFNVADDTAENHLIRVKALGDGDNHGLTESVAAVLQIQDESTYLKAVKLVEAFMSNVYRQAANVGENQSSSQVTEEQFSPQLAGDHISPRLTDIQALFQIFIRAFKINDWVRLTAREIQAVGFICALTASTTFELSQKIIDADASKQSQDRRADKKPQISQSASTSSASLKGTSSRMQSSERRTVLQNLSLNDKTQTSIVADDDMAIDEPEAQSKSVERRIVAKIAVELMEVANDAMSMGDGSLSDAASLGVAPAAICKLIGQTKLLNQRQLQLTLMFLQNVFSRNFRRGAVSSSATGVWNQNWAKVQNRGYAVEAFKIVCQQSSASGGHPVASFGLVEGSAHALKAAELARFGGVNKVQDYLETVRELVFTGKMSKFNDWGQRRNDGSDKKRRVNNLFVGDRIKASVKKHRIAT